MYTYNIRAWYVCSWYVAYNIWELQLMPLTLPILSLSIFLKKSLLFDNYWKKARWWFSFHLVSATNTLQLVNYLMWLLSNTQYHFWAHHYSQSIKYRLISVWLIFGSIIYFIVSNLLLYNQYSDVTTSALTPLVFLSTRHPLWISLTFIPSFYTLLVSPDTNITCIPVIVCVPPRM